MNLKTRLFGPQWEHKDPAQRIEAIRQLADPALEAELPRLAREDEAAEVRLMALRRLDQEALWIQAALDDPDPAVSREAGQEVLRAIRSEPVEDTTARLAWLEALDDAGTIRELAVNARDLKLRRKALERISAQGFLGDRFVKEPDDGLAGEILARIDQISTLERISGKLRVSSKRRYQQAKQRLNQLQAAAGDEKAAASDAERVVIEAERLGRGDWQGDRAEQLAELERQWSELETIPDGLQRRFQGAVRIVRAALERPAPTSPSEAHTVEAEPAEPADKTGTDASLQSVADRILATVPGKIKADQIAQLVSAWDRAWNQVEHGPANLALKDRIIPHVRALQEQAGSPGQHESKDPGEDYNAIAERVKEQVEELAEVLEAGDIRRGDELLRSARSQHDRLPMRARPEGIDGRLTRMAGRLKEMRDWQHWSNNKLRDELIARIEALPESGQHPDAITGELKRARARWQSLEEQEVLPGDKRRHAAPSGQWRRFQAACKQAFESAKPYFEQRLQVQQEALEQLEAFIAASTETAANEQAGSDQLLPPLRAARKAIRHLDDIPPRERGRMAGKLRQLMDRLSKRLDQRFDEVEQTKRRLIAEARKLEHEKDLKSAIEQAKSLQAQWQQAGSTRRRLENKLWKEFREPIDPLFEKLKGEREERDSETRALMAEFEALCEQAEALSGLPETELAEAENRMAGLIQDWSSRQVRSPALRKRFDKAAEGFSRRLEATREQAREAARNHLQALAAAAQELWTARSAGKLAEVAARHQALLEPEQVDDPKHKQLVAACRRFADYQPGDQSDEKVDEKVDEKQLAETVRANANKARQVTVEMEFLAGIESPAQDRKQRMDYQVRRLSERLSERAEQPSLAEEMELLLERWYQSFPMPEEAFDELKKRFEKGLGIVEKMTGG